MKITKNDIRLMGNVLKKVFARPAYLSIAVLVSVAILVLAIWLPNISLIWETVWSPSYEFGQKVAILWSSLGAIMTNFTALSRTFTILLAALTGMNIALFVYYLKSRLRLEREAGTSLLGMFFGLVGVGCASCGSVILSSIFGLGATASFIGLFPLDGAEFGLLGIIILLWANLSLVKKIQQPATCKI